MWSSFRSSRVPELAIYLFVQVLAYLIDFGSFLLGLNVFSADALVANFGGKAAAGLFAFIVHRYVTFFHVEREPFGRQLLKYVVVLIATTTLSSLLISLLRHMLSDIRLVKFLADLLTVFASFLVAKFFIFRAARN